MRVCVCIHRLLVACRSVCVCVCIYLYKRSPLSTALFHNELLWKRKQKICWGLVLAESNGKGMERQWRGVLFAAWLNLKYVYVQALLQQIVHVTFPARVVCNNMLKLNQVLDSAQ